MFTEVRDENRRSAERTSSWHVPPDLQERVKAWVAERECEQKCEEERDDEEKGD